MSDDRLLRRITEFLDKNHPCGCFDEDCPGNDWEALEIVDMVRSFLDDTVGGSSVRPFRG